MFGAYSGFRRGALGGENASQAKECPGLRIQGHTEFAGSRARVEDTRGAGISRESSKKLTQ